MTTDPVEELQSRLRDFADQRDWGQFHNPKNLVMALAGEVGELIEHYQWLTPEQAQELTHDPESKAEVTDELADIAIYLLRLADILNIGVLEAAHNKISSNEDRYPADVVRGRADIGPQYY